MAVELTADRVTRLYRDGVSSVERITSNLSDEAWDLPACGHWTGTQTARHLLAVARWYHEWLDRAIGGDVSHPFPAAELDDRNEAALEAVGGLSGQEAVAEFVQTAGAYLERAVDHWDLAYVYPFGTVTAGLHLGVAATEWHLHGWDLSHTANQRHRPEDPQGLFVAAGMCLAEARGGFWGAVLRLVVPLGARRKPWPTILKRSGRSPDRGDDHR